MKPDASEKPAHRDRPLLRRLAILLGFALAAIGVFGAFVPLMPSTVFFIAAAACFAYASPRLEAWLLSFDFIGAPVRAWRERGAIPRRAKWLASAGMSVGLAAFALSGPRPIWLIAASVVLAGCAAFIWTRPD